MTTHPAHHSNTAILFGKCGLLKMFKALGVVV
jgi:hypothetical protein